MITVLLFICIGLFIAIITITSDWKKHNIPLEEMGNIGEQRVSTIGYKISICIWRPIVALFLGMFVGALIALFVGLFFKKKDAVVKTVSIYSMNDVFGTSGSFFLGIGSVKTEPYYFFYKKIDNGLVLDKIQTEGTTIIEQDSTSPKIEYLGKEFASESAWLWVIPGGGCGCSNARIIVPKNSVKQGFNFDLK